MQRQIRAAILGCGNIAEHYTQHMQRYPELNLVGFADIDPSRAIKFAEKFGGRSYANIDELLDDPSIDLIVNLTIHKAHAGVIERCLEAGKHVHTEKPLALSSVDAHRLVALAEKKGIRLSSAPSNYMGEAQQTVWREIRDGRIGTPRLVYAEVNHGRIEAWHPNPEPFYEVGILWDVAVYPLTLVTTFFGAVKSVTGFGKVLYPDRVTQEGRPFHITTPDYYLAAVELESGPIVRLSANFYVDGGKQRGSMEFHGDGGSVYLGDFQTFNPPVEARAYGKSYEPVPFVREPQESGEFSRGVQDLAQAMLAGRPHRTNAAHAAHVVDIVSAIEQSARENKRVSIASTFSPPSPMDWA